MRMMLLTGAACVVLAACGGGASDRDAIVSNCTAEGESEAVCGCIADAMEAKLSPAVFQKVANAVKDEDRSPSDLLSTLPLDEQQEFVKILPDVMSCATSVEEG